MEIHYFFICHGSRSLPIEGCCVRASSDVILSGTPFQRWSGKHRRCDGTAYRRARADAGEGGLTARSVRAQNTRLADLGNLLESILIGESCSSEPGLQCCYPVQASTRQKTTTIKRRRPGGDPFAPYRRLQPRTRFFRGGIPQTSPGMTRPRLACGRPPRKTSVPVCIHRSIVFLVHTLMSHRGQEEENVI